MPPGPDPAGEATIESRSAYQGRLLDVRVDRVRLPDGREAEREIVRHPGAAAVLPVLPPAGGETGKRLVLLRQYRYAADGVLWEVPAGTLEPGEGPEACASRELEEEAGYRAGELERLTTVLTTPGFTDERIWLFVARDLQETAPSPEEGEQLSRRIVPLDEALQMLGDGKIQDAKSICALLFALRYGGLEG